MRIFAKIKIVGYNTYNDYELIRNADGELVWGWRGNVMGSYNLQFEVDDNRIILNSFTLKFKPEDLVLPEAQ